MIEQMQEHDKTTESRGVRLIYYGAWIPIIGLLFYIALIFIGQTQPVKGRIRFKRLSRGLVAMLFLSVAPIVGFVLWAELPSECYPVLNLFTKHGYYTRSNGYGHVKYKAYYRFGKQFREVLIDYFPSGIKRNEKHFVDGKRNGISSVWYDNGQIRWEEFYLNGNRHGMCYWYKRNGDLEHSMLYTDGISQEQIESAKKDGVAPMIEIDLGGGVKMQMVYIPAGEFMMGSSKEEIGRLNKVYEFHGKEESPQHKVTIKDGFYLCRTEVTQAQWVAVMKENPSYFQDGIRGVAKDTGNYPVEQVSWNDAHRFLINLNRLGKGTFRLPSEAEWEYACRAGSTTRYSFGDDEIDLDEYAWNGCSTYMVASTLANNWGIFDMHGNIEELCEDDWHPNYIGAPNDSTAWIDAPRSKHRVHRGVYWFNCRSASRSLCDPVKDYIRDRSGFRLARSLR